MGGKRNLCGKKKEIEEFIIFGRASAHFAYQGIGIGRGLFYSRIKVPSLLQFSRSQAASLQSEGPLYQITFRLLLLPLQWVFLRERFIQLITRVLCCSGYCCPLQVSASKGQRQSWLGTERGRCHLCPRSTSHSRDAMNALRWGESALNPPAAHPPPCAISCAWCPHRGAEVQNGIWTLPGLSWSPGEGAV